MNSSESFHSKPNNSSYTGHSNIAIAPLMCYLEFNVTFYIL